MSLKVSSEEHCYLVVKNPTLQLLCWFKLIINRNLRGESPNPLIERREKGLSVVGLWESTIHARKFQDAVN